MNTDLISALTRLAKGELLQVHDGQGKGLAVFEGVAWVTQENDPRDRVAEPRRDVHVRPAGLGDRAGLERQQRLAVREAGTGAQASHSALVAAQ